MPQDQDLVRDFIHAYECKLVKGNEDGLVQLPKVFVSSY